MPVTLLATESQLQQVSNKEAAVENRIFPEDLKTLAGDILVLKTLRDEIVSGRHAFYRAASNARSGASLPDRPPDASNPGTSKVPQSFQSSLLHRVGNIKNSGQAEQTSKSDLYLPEAHQVGQRYMESIVGRAARRSSAKYETDESNFQNRRRGVEGKRVHRSPDPPSTQTHLGVGHSAERRNVSNGSRGYRRSRSPLGRPDDLDYGVHDRGPATTAPYGDKRNLDRHHSRDQPSWKPSTFGRERGRPPRNRSYSPPRRRAASPPAQMPGQSRPSRPVSAVPDSRQSRKSSMAGRDAGRKKPSQNYTVHEADVASSRQNSYSHRLQGAQQDMEQFSTTKSIQAEPSSGSHPVQGHTSASITSAGSMFARNELASRSPMHATNFSGVPASAPAISSQFSSIIATGQHSESPVAMSSGNVHAVDSNPYVSLVPWHGDQSSENYPSAETIPASFQNFQQTVYPYSVPYSQSYSGNAGYNSVYQQFAGLNAAYTQYFPSDAFYSQ